MKWFCMVLCGVIVASPAAAQAERYELGQRLKAFEKAWDETIDAAARKAALAIVAQATPQFFALQLGEAGRTLDQARWALAGAEPDADVKWLTSLYAVPEKRLYDADVNEVKVGVKHFYKAAGIAPIATVTLQLGTEKPVTVPLEKRPVTVSLPRSAKHVGDVWLVLQCRIGDRVVHEKQVVVGFLEKLDEGFKTQREMLKTAMADLDPLTHRCGLEYATWTEKLAVMQNLAEGETLETDFRTMTHGVGVLKMHPTGVTNDFTGAVNAIGLRKQWYALPHSYDLLLPLDDVTLALPLSKKRNMVFRLACPPVKADKSPHPLVIALHGAGGTENLFFEGYGDGRVVSECRRRGWFVAAPRSTLSFTGGPPLDKLVDELAARFPIDRRRVFLVGHSMGAAQALAALQEHPKLFAGAALMGGGGRVTDATAIGKLPVLVGVGTKDFARGMAKSTADAMTKAGMTAVKFKEYADVEHLVIVREALPDAFAMFDEIVKAP